MWIHHRFFSNLSIDRYLGGFYFGATMNNVVMNIHVHIVLWIYVSVIFGYTPRMELLGYMVSIVLNFEGNVNLFSKEGPLLYLQ